MKNRRIINAMLPYVPEYCINFSKIELMTELDKQSELLRAKLNLETAQMPWKELQRYFAGGTVIAVNNKLDLVNVAVSIANDDKASVTKWMAKNLVAKVSDAQAVTWLETDAMLWTVVVKPWILVQQDKDAMKMH